MCYSFWGVSPFRSRDIGNNDLGSSLEKLDDFALPENEIVNDLGCIH